MTKKTKIIKEFITTKLVVQKILKGVLCRGKEDECNQETTIKNKLH
jgi:hypothetical protein